MTNIWSRNLNCVSAMTPSPDDLFVVTTVFGTRVSVPPIHEYEAALRVAGAFADDVPHPRPVVVKLLCLSQAEMTGAPGIDPATVFQRQTPAPVRADAMQLLVNMGARAK